MLSTDAVQTSSGYETENGLRFSCASTVNLTKGTFSWVPEMRLILACVCLIVASLSLATRVCATESRVDNVFGDPLLTPAVTLAGVMNPASQPILALVKIGEGTHRRIIAAGFRGLVLISDDGASHWRQARVPVQSDLVALCFISDRRGWAVGHDGVILHTEDGGESWTKQFDGDAAHDVMTAYYKTRIANGEHQLQRFLDEVELNTKDGATLPFLSVYFENEKIGYAVGSFGMLAETEDGGKTWRPWLDHIDNEKFLNLNDIRKVGSDIYIAGEQGTVYRLDRDKQRFVAVSTSYKGSFFRIAGNEKYLLAMGLNGTAFRSGDLGQSWKAVKTGVHTSLTSASLSADGKTIVLTAEGGQALYSTDDAQTFMPLAMHKPMLFADVVDGDDDWFVFAGYQGIAREKVPAANKSAPVQK